MDYFSYLDMRSIETIEMNFPIIASLDKLRFCWR